MSLEPHAAGTRTTVSREAAERTAEVKRQACDSQVYRNGVSAVAAEAVTNYVG
jgi:hypothetical protein